MDLRHLSLLLLCLEPFEFLGLLRHGLLSLRR